MNGTPKSTNFQQVENSPVPCEHRPKGKTTEQKKIMLLVLLINNNCDYNEQK